MNQSQFSKLAGVSREAVRKALACNPPRLIAVGGDLDPSHPVNAAFILNRQGAGKSNTEKPAQKPKREKPGPAVPSVIDIIRDDEQSAGECADLGKIARQAIIDKAGKLAEEKRKLQIQNAKLRGELISRKLIRVVFGKIYEIDQNEYLTIKDKVIPDIAAIFGSTDPEKMMEAGKRLDDELWKTLRHVQHVIDKFLKSVGDNPA